MEEMEESRNDLMQRVHSSMATSSSSIPKQQQQHLLQNRFDPPHINPAQTRGPYRHFSPNLSSPESMKRPGIPPSHPNAPPTSPYSRSPSSGSHNFTTVPCHSRSLSQPAFFSLDSLPPLSPSPYRDSTSASTSPSDPISADVSMDDRDVPPPPVPLPPRKAHRRSHSEIPFSFAQSSLPMAAVPPLPQRGHGFLERSATAKQAQFVKQESDWDRDGESSAEGMGERKSEGDVGDDLLNAFMNLDNFDPLNSSGTEDKREDLDSRASGSKTNGADSSENEAESTMNEGGSSAQLRANLGSSTERKEGTKRSAVGDLTPMAIPSRHCRSISMDSFMGKLHFGDESPKLPPSPGMQAGQHSHNNSMDGTSNTFSLEFGNGEFSGAELKKIMANDKLAEIAMADPKRAKRILANRQSAARSKERKMRYISELEHKVQTLQQEATTLSAQLTLLQRDSTGLTSQNNELKFRLQAMEQQAQLRDALNEALTAEVQRLKLATGELGDAHPSNSLNQQIQMNNQIFQMQQLQKQQQKHQQSTHGSHYQLQQQQQNNAATKHESNK